METLTNRAQPNNWIELTGKGAVPCPLPEAGHPQLHVVVFQSPAERRGLLVGRPRLALKTIRGGNRWPSRQTAI